MPAKKEMRLNARKTPVAEVSTVLCPCSDSRGGGEGMNSTIAVLETEHVRVDHCLRDSVAQLVNVVEIGCGVLDNLGIPVSIL